MDEIKVETTPGRRALLARKGEILYGKFCGTKGRGICAESFALHQLRLGNVEAVADLAGFLDRQLATLRECDPDGLLAMTADLAGRIRRLLATEA